MSKEELYKALKIFNREDLTYENDEFYNDFEEYMNFMEQEKAIEVFMSTRDMVKYSKLEQEIERLNKRVKECEEAYLRTRHQYSELENKYLTDEYIINELEDSIVGKINVLYQVRGQSNAIQELRILLRQLRELKGDSSNDNNGNI